MPAPPIQPEPQHSGTAAEGMGPLAVPAFSPLYQQIKGLILQSLQGGEWKPGEVIPSEMELAARYRVSQGTVRKGIVKTPRSVAYDILREILREARQFNPREIRVLAHPKVIDLLSDEESPHLAGLSDFIGKPISLVSEPVMHQDEFDVVLI